MNTESNELNSFSTLERPFFPENSVDFLKVEYATPKKIKEAMKGRRVNVREEGVRFTLGVSVTAITKEDPGVIFFRGARMCSLFLMIDDEGNAVGTHSPTIPNSTEDEQTMRQKVDSFIESGMGVLKGRSVFVFTGTNINPGWEQRRDTLSSYVIGHNKRKEYYGEQPMINLTIRPEESVNRKLDNREKLVRRLVDVLGRLRTQRTGEIVLPASTRNISGFIFIPRYVDSGGENRLIILDQNSDWEGIEKTLRKITPHK